MKCHFTEFLRKYFRQTAAFPDCRTYRPFPTVDPVNNGFQAVDFFLPAPCFFPAAFFEVPDVFAAEDSSSTAEDFSPTVFSLALSAFSAAVPLDSAAFP